MIRRDVVRREVYEVDIEQGESAVSVKSLLSLLPATALLVDVDDCNGTFTLTFEKEIAE